MWVICLHSCWYGRIGRICSLWQGLRQKGNHSSVLEKKGSWLALFQYCINGLSNHQPYTVGIPLNPTLVSCWSFMNNCWTPWSHTAYDPQLPQLLGAWSWTVKSLSGATSSQYQAKRWENGCKYCKANTLFSGSSPWYKVSISLQSRPLVHCAVIKHDLHIWMRLFAVLLPMS